LSTERLKHRSCVGASASFALVPYALYVRYVPFGRLVSTV
jgi:hypothetical protein